MMRPVDSSANALAYDGFLTVQADPAQSGYVNPGQPVDALRLYRGPR